jgi:tetratricopeptide (TPR) repeat protein
MNSSAMKSLAVFLLLILSCGTLVLAQNRSIDSLRAVLKTEKADSSRVKTLNVLSIKLLAVHYDTALFYAKTSRKLAESLNFKKGLAEALRSIGTIYKYKGSYDSAIYYDTKSLDVNLERDDKTGIAANYSNLGTVYDMQGNFPKALEYQFKSLAMDSELMDKVRMGANYSNIGIVYYEQGNYPYALNYELKALSIAKELHNREASGKDVSIIGIIYQQQKSYSQALAYELQALAIDSALGNKQDVALNLGNTAIVYSYMGNQDKAIEYFSKALQINQEIGDKAGEALNMANIADMYELLGNNDKALVCDRKALTICKQIGDKNDMALAYLGIGVIYMRQKKYELAKIELDSSLMIDKQVGLMENLKSDYEQMAKLDSAKGDFKTAWNDYKIYIRYRDSLINDGNTKKLVQEQMNYEFDQKQAAEKAEQDKKDAVHKEELKKQKITIYAVSVGLFLVLLLAVAIFRNLQLSRKKTKIIIEQKTEVEKKNALIEQQKTIVEEKNKEILDSIAYAKRLQDAILPPLSVIEKYLPDSFLLYKPKDIVAGDFYWMEHFPQPHLNPPHQGVLKKLEESKVSPNGGDREGADTILIAACDCTGHGVPGAMVSVVCSNALNRTVKEFKITEPGKILDKVRELVIETFEKSESNVQDGMDISLLSITGPTFIARNEARLNDQVGQAISSAEKRLPRPDDGPRSDGTIQLQWAGAYNSLWYIADGKVIEIPADKQPIGKTDNPKPFTTHTITLNPPSEGREAATIYLFTDGYADQFGGSKGKKFKYKQLQELLSANWQMSMQEQKKLLENTLESWKGNLEQVDDILVMGIRIGNDKR